MLIHKLFDCVRIFAFFSTALSSSYACEPTQIPDQHLFFQSIWTGNNNAVAAAILSNPKLLKSINSFGESGLTWASLAANKEAARMLLNAGAEINYKTCDGTSALHKAAPKGDEELVTLLIEAGGDLTAVDHDSSNVLSFAVFASNIPMIKVLASRTGHFGRMANECLCIFKAVDQDNIEILELLLKNGADVNVRDAFSRTPLIAVTRDRERLIPLLLKAGANTNQVDSNGKNAMDHARFFNNEKAVNALMSQR